MCGAQGCIELWNGHMMNNSTPHVDILEMSRDWWNPRVPTPSPSNFNWVYPLFYSPFPMSFINLLFLYLSNNCGMLHYISGDQFKIQVVIRRPNGVGQQLGIERSQRLESYLQSIPRIQIVACLTPYSAKGLIKAAIRSENPMIFFFSMFCFTISRRGFQMKSMCYHLRKPRRDSQPK